MLLSERCWPREMKVPHNKQFTKMFQIDCQQFVVAFFENEVGTSLHARVSGCFQLPQLPCFSS